MSLAADATGGPLKAPRAKVLPHYIERAPGTSRTKVSYMTEPNFDAHAENKSNGHRWFLMLNCLLLTRVTDDREATSTAGKDDNFDEEVGAYIRNLLAGFTNPAHADDLLSHLFDYDVDLLKKTHAAADAAVRYALCKTENDLVVLSVAVFDAREVARLGASEFKHGSQGQMGRSGAHYYFAFSYVNAVASVSATASALLEKIGIGLDKYVTILSYITGKPFDLAGRLAEGEVYHLVRSVETAGKRMRLERKQDEFLDAYLEWRERRTEDAKKRVLFIAQELQKIDPTFTCDMPGTQY